MDSGNCWSCLVCSVVWTVALCVCMTSLAAVTTTASSTLPTSSMTLMLAGVAARIGTSGVLKVLNPVSETVTV